LTSRAGTGAVAGAGPGKGACASAAKCKAEKQNAAHKVAAFVDMAFINIARRV
jgi:hypothetical protein